jgi:tripartite-type tricarboxylate transporter receptor subunit TctC
VGEAHASEWNAATACSYAVPIASESTGIDVKREVFQSLGRQIQMKLWRRHFLHLTAGVAALAAVTQIAVAQAYPSRPVRIVVGFAAGGSADILMRLIGHWLTERLGQPFIIENRVGAGSNIAAEVVVHAPPDGYTLLSIGVPHAINATLYERLGYNLIRDIAPVASLIAASSVMAVNPSFVAQSVPEFIAYAKANPGKLNMASSGNGAGSHVYGELFKMLTGVNMVHVPYRGAPPALTDLISGHVQVMFPDMPSSIEYINAGKLRALAVTSAIRAEALPEIPAVGEFVSGYEASSWFGIGAPKETPVEIIDKLNREINVALMDPKMRVQLAKLGGTVLAGTPADFGKLIANETDKWAKVVKFSGAKLD